MNKTYTISDIAATFSVSERTAQRWVESLVIKEKGKILIPEDIFNLLKSRYAPDTDVQEFERLEYFTNEEYEEFHKRLVEYPILKDQLDYHRKSAESHNRQMEILLQSVQQRNFIEATEKNLENK